MKQRIFFDMPIWYHLTHGTMSMSEFENFQVESVYTNYFECITNLSLGRNNREMIIKVAKTILTSAKFHKVISPFAYIDYLTTNNFNESGRFFENDNVFKAMGAISEGNMVHNYENVLGEFEQREGNIVSEIKDRLKKIKNENLIEYVKHEIINDVSFITKKPENFDNFNWEKLELFVGARSKLYESILMQQDSFKRNDIYDLLNLVYVHPGDIYFTCEKKWERLITAAGLGHYLYKGPNYLKCKCQV